MNKLFRYIFSREIIISLIFLVFLIFIYSLLRFGFYIANHNFFANINSLEILKNFLEGVRFDLSAIVIINLPVLLLFNLPVNLRKQKWYRYFLFFLFFLINITAICLNIADYGYFPTIERRLLWEPYTMLPDIVRTIPGLIANHFILFTIFIFACISFFLFARYLYKKADGKINLTFNYVSASVSFILIIIFSVIAIRGGIQLKPIRIANAFTNNQMEQGYLTLNTTYTVVSSYFQQKLPEFSFFSNDEANKIIQRIIKADDEKMLDPAYPFMRSKSPSGEMKKMNVVIFIMESWSASFVGSITGEKSFTPFFDNLAAGGILFTNYFASGQRSIEGIPSILASLPAIYSNSIIGSLAESDKIRGLGSILSEKGYTTSFHHGGVTGTMGFDAFTKIAGFIKYYGKESYPNLNDDLTDGMWGICDEPFFLQTEKVISSFKEPFCSAIFSLSSHDPYKIPDNRLNLFEQYKNESEIERAVRYSDFSLEQFFKKASQEAWFNNTIFIITCDHTLFDTRTGFYTAFHSPFLIYSPSLIKPAKNKRTVSHTDVLPTILELLKIKTVYSSMGFSAVDSTKEKYAFVKYGSYYGIISDDYVLLNDLTQAPKIFNYHLDPQLKNNLSLNLKDEIDDLNKKLLAFIQQATHAIGENKIYK